MPLESKPLDLDFVDPPPVTDSLDFFLRDFLGMSGRSREGELVPWLDSCSWRVNLTLPLPSDESLD